MEVVRETIAEEFDRHAEILPRLTKRQQKKFEDILDLTASEPIYAGSLKFLTTCLEKAHGRQVIVLIDEYDMPIETAYTHGFFDAAVSFFRRFLGGGLKDNDSLKKGVLTGILRIAKESVFSGLNNLTIHSILDEPFSGIDPIVVAEAQEIIKDLKNRGLGILLTDHNVRETLSITDRSYLIADGKVLISGTADDLINDPKARKIYLGEKFRM